MRALSLLALSLLPSLAAAQTIQSQPVQVLHRFASSPANPLAPLVQVPGGDFYTVTPAGILRVTTAGQVTLIPGSTYDMQWGSLVLASDGGLYGSTIGRFRDFGGADTIFRFDPATGDRRTIHRFLSPTEGRSPFGGLVASGGSLYGVTTKGPGDALAGTIFHVVVATGQVITDHVFGTSPSSVVQPTSQLVVGADGLLYGTTALPGTGAIYRFDPASGVVTLMHQLSAAEGAGLNGAGLNGLVLGADGRLYGSAAGGGAAGIGTLFRYTPGTATFELLYSLGSNAGDGSSPGPLTAGGDGHFYGVTSTRGTAPFPSTTTDWTVFRLRAGAGGSFTYETLRTLDGDTHGKPSQTGLTRGADGLLYGYATYGGPTLAGTATHFVLGGPGGPPGHGTLFRFDPAEGGPAGNTIAFTLLNTFPFVSSAGPSTPTPGPDGFLYGLTSAGGSTNRGAVYRLNATTGAVTILGEVPGGLTGRTANSRLTAAADGMLYGISRTFAPSEPTERIIRVNPGTGTATAVPNSGAPTELVPSPAGVLYGIGPVVLGGFVKFDTAASLLVSLSSYFSNGGPTPVTVTSDGQVYAVRQYQVAIGNGQATRTSLLRLTQAPPFGFDEIVLSDAIVAIDRLLEGPGGTTYLGARYANDPLVGSSADDQWAIVSANRTTGALSRVCTIPPQPANTVGNFSVGPDGALYGFMTYLAQRMVRCDPATGAVTFTALPPGLGSVSGPLVSVNGMLYGAAGNVLFRFAPGATQPPLDTDADGLPNVWETAYGLDPFSTGVGNGAADDPDSDGRTNAQELADGTHPRGFFTRLFAEGATGPFFRTRFDLTVPTYEPATVRMRLGGAGAFVSTDVVVPPRSHVDLDPATLPGLEHAAFSTIIESDVEIAVDREMTWAATAGYGSHLETAIAAPSTTWYFAEGATTGAFSLFYLLQNPNGATVEATVRYLLPAGQPPIEKRYNLPPFSRTTIEVDNQSALLATADVSAIVTAPSPIVAERAMYYSQPGQVFAAGHESAGVTAPALEWFLAEGATGPFFDLFVLIANPNPTAATVEVEYLLPGGGSLTKAYTVAGHSRFTIFVDDEQLPAGSGTRPFAATSVSMAVRSTNAVPIVVERTMWWPGPTVTPNFWYEAHNSPGVTSAATRWAIGGAAIGGSDGSDTYVLIANTTATAGRARVMLAGADWGPWSVAVDVPAKSRVTVPLRSAFVPVPPDGRYGVVVESLGPNPVPLVVERATYANPGGVQWGRGGNALATPLP